MDTQDSPDDAQDRAEAKEGGSDHAEANVAQAKAEQQPSAGRTESPDNEAQNEGRATHQISPADRAGQGGREGGAVDFSRSEMQLLERTARKDPFWRISTEARKSVPDAMIEIVEHAKSPRARVAAAKVLVAMQLSNEPPAPTAAGNVNSGNVLQVTEIVVRSPDEAREVLAALPPPGDTSRV